MVKMGKEEEEEEVVVVVSGRSTVLCVSVVGAWRRRCWRGGMEGSVASGVASGLF